MDDATGYPHQQPCPAGGGGRDGDAFGELTARVRAALETYANVHRGSGHHSLAATHLYERAREVVLDHLGLDRRRWVVIFCSPRQAELLRTRFGQRGCHVVSSRELGLAMGLRAVAIPRRALPSGPPPWPGGGTARLVGEDWVVWAKAPARFEPGTPAVVNAVALANALTLGCKPPSDATVAASQTEPAAASRAQPVVASQAQVVAASETAVASQTVAEPPVPGDPQATTARRAAVDIVHNDRLMHLSGRELLAELRKTLVGQRVSVPTTAGPRPFVPLDNAASTPTFEPVLDAAIQGWRRPEPVRQEIVREVRSVCAETLGAPSADYEVIFTANTTESIGLVAESLAGEPDPEVSPVVLATTMEHNSNELPWRYVTGVSLVHLPVDPEGFVDLAALQALLREYNEEHGHGDRRITLVAVSGASNVLGTCNDLAAIGQVAHRFGARLLVDAAQLVAHRPVDMAACGIDYLAFSAHKCYAPFGTGVLVARRGMLRLRDAELASIRASGEENAGGVAALGKALVLLRRIGLDVVRQEEQELTAQALRGMARIPGVTRYGVRAPESPRFVDRGGVILFGVKSKLAARVAGELAERGGIGVRSGCHCAHMVIKSLLGISPRLEQFQRLLLNVFPSLSLPGLTRISLGIENTPDDVDTFLTVLAGIAGEPAAGSAPTKRARADVQRDMREFVQAAADRAGLSGPHRAGRTPALASARS